MHELDIDARAYTGRTWRYRVADPSHLVSDFTALAGDRSVSLERDNLQGTAARHKQGFVVELPPGDSGTTLHKRPVLDRPQPDAA